MEVLSAWNQLKGVTYGNAVPRIYPVLNKSEIFLREEFYPGKFQYGGENLWAAPLDFGGKIVF